MIRNVRLTPILVLVALSLSLVMGGCGSKAANQPDMGTDTTTSGTMTSADPTMAGVYNVGPSTDSVAATVSTPVLAPTPQPSVAPVTDPTTTPSAAPTTAPSQAPIDLAYALRATVTNTQSHGILLWKTLSATVEVQNPSFLKQQTGTVVVTFTKSGSVVETQQLSVALAPAEIRDYTVTSTKNADAATVDVTTTP